MRRTLVCAATVSAVAVAQAAITQAPSLPAQVRITPLEAFAGPDGFVFEARGTARMEGQSWVADVVDVTSGKLIVDPMAGFHAIWQGQVGHPDAITWDGFTVEWVRPEGGELDFSTVHAYPTVRGETGTKHGFGYLGGNLFEDDATLPEGQNLLWVMGPGFLERIAYENFGSGVEVNPVAFARIEVVAVPEPASYMLMGAGLGLMGALARRRASIAKAERG